MIDSHNHLQDPLISNLAGSLPAIGITRAVVNGTRESDWEAVAALASRHDWVLPCYGLHPWWQAERSPDWESRLRERLAASPCAIGETGLDQWMQNPDPADQERVLRAHLRLAAEWDRPITIHCLKAWRPLWDVLSTETLPSCGFLLHAYSGSLEMAERFATKGAYFSFNGYFLHDRKSKTREMFARLPADRLLLETDAPSMPLPESDARFLPPSPNHPGNLSVVYKALAGIRQVETTELSTLIQENFTRLFGRCVK